MIDIGKQEVSIECPSCKKQIKITLHQVSKGTTITCRCGQKIQLEDKNNSAKKGIKKMNKAFGDIDKSLKGLFK